MGSHMLCAALLSAVVVLSWLLLGRYARAGYALGLAKVVDLSNELVAQQEDDKGREAAQVVRKYVLALVSQAALGRNKGKQ